MNVYDELLQRGFVEQVTDEEAVRSALAQGPVTAYIGFDPSADSFHAGSLVPIMALVHLQRYGHRPIALLGGGTVLIGDPSGKSEMRPMLTKEDVDRHSVGLRSQLARFLDLSDQKALMVDNKEWLCELNLIDFLREVGRHFSVNRMLTAETYRSRLETGLSFLEFNYMLLQAYDFYMLYTTQGCTMQMGGNDQWGNIVAGVELIRRKAQGKAEAMTFPLLVTSSGTKMGKTESGALWLDERRTSPYDYYQYWVNVDDRDVVRFLMLFTLLPVGEIEAARALSGSELRAAKAVLAFEATCLVHGQEKALEARSAAVSAFGDMNIPPDLLPSSAVPRQSAGDLGGVPRTLVPREALEQGIPAFVLFADLGLAKSRSEARRLINQGGGYMNGQRIDAHDRLITLQDLQEGAITLRAGRKQVHRVELG